MADPGLPGRLDLELYRGDTRVWTAAFKDDDGVALDLSGRVWVCQIRDDKDRTNDPIATVTVDDTDAATGTLTLTLSAGEAAGLGNDKTKLYWDLQSDASGTVQTWLYGNVKVAGDVSVGTDDVVS